MNDGYGIFTYNPYTGNEIDHYETRFCMDLWTDDLPKNT